MHPEHIEQLYAIYLAQVSYAPHCRFTPDQARFRDELLGLAAPANMFPTPRQSHVFVAEVSGVAHGFARLTTYQAWDKVEHQAIAGLFFAHESAGHALIRNLRGACDQRRTPGVPAYA